jgi:hypothetical protein
MMMNMTWRGTDCHPAAERRGMYCALFAAISLAASPLHAQHKHDADSARLVGVADAAMSGPLSANARLHMELSPARTPTRGDTSRAILVVNKLRVALSRFQDTATAVAEGYRLFMPNLKQQRVFHFTNYRNAFLEAFRFDPTRPTSLLYQRDRSGKLRLVGAMYTAPKRMPVERLDERIPLSIARWHKHVNWCLPPKGSERRWLERRGGAPVFGPESSIATREACDAVGGQFHENLFGWMLHANVFAGQDLTTVFGHDH